MWAYAFLGPAFFFLFVLILFPILFAFWISLHDWSLIPREFPFDRPEELRRGLQGSLTLKSLRNTLVYTVGAVPVSMALSLILALIMNQDKLPFRTGFRTAYFIPVITSWVAVSFVWVWMFEPRYGLVNAFLALVRHHGHQMAGLPVLGVAGHHDRLDLEGPRLQHGDLPGRLAGHPARAARGGQD